MLCEGTRLDELDMALLDELEVGVVFILLELEDARALDELELALLEVSREDVVGFDAELELEAAWLEDVGLLEDEDVAGFGMLLELVATDIVDEDETGLLLLDFVSMLDVVPGRLEEALDEDVGLAGMLDELEEIFADEEL